MILAGASQHIEQREFARLRLVILIGAFVYPAWGLFAKWAHPNENDPISLRLAVAFGLLASWFITGRVKRSIQHFDKIILIQAVLISTHLYWLAFINSWQADYVIGLLIYSWLVLSLLKNRLYSSLYACAFLVPAFGAFLLESPKFPISLSLVSIGIGLIGGLFSNFTRNEFLTKLKQSEQRSYIILSNMSEGVMLYDREGRIISFNPNAPRILGLRYEFFAGRSYSRTSLRMVSESGEDLYPDEQPQELARLTGVVKQEVPVMIDRSDGSRSWISLTAIPIIDGNRSAPYPVLLTCRDITEAKENQQRLLEQKAVLASASKLTALGEMAAGIAHEINNPLAIISGRATQLSRLVATNKLTNEAVLPIAQKIEETVRRMSRIIVSMRNVSRENADDPIERTSLTSIIDDSLALCRESLVSGHVEIKCDIPQGLEIEARAGSIAQVILNLISNARDAVAESEEKWISISVHSQESSLSIVVEDSGPGIPDSVREKIMQPFFTTKEVGKGTGLGLSISQGIAKAHGGRLYLDPESKRTRFILELPQLPRLEKAKVA